MEYPDAIDGGRSLGQTLARTSHLFADTATLRTAMTAADDVFGDVAGRYVGVVVALAVAYAHAHQVHEPVAARELVAAAHAEPAMLDEAREQLVDLDFLPTRVRNRADRLLATAAEVAARTGWPAPTT